MRLASALGLILAALPAAHANQAPSAACAVDPLNGQWPATGQFLAGQSLAGFSDSMDADQRAAWKSYSTISGSDWRILQARYLSRIDAWRMKAIGNTAAPRSAFYPFGGPDAANLLAFFPDAREYVIIGLEPVGCIPSHLEDYTPDYFTELRQNLSSVVALGFFKTNEMDGNFKQGSVNGVLPLLLFLIARSGGTVSDVSPIGISSTGALVPNTPDTKLETRGVAIQFSDSQHGAHTLRYFALNLLNSRLSVKPGTMRYLSSLPEPVTLVKSASYLMHKARFSMIRGLILNQSRLVVEDDSGIPYHYFEPAAWDVHLYGVYNDPIKLFKNSGQDDLQAAFATRTDIQPLDFGIGYRHRGESNLLVAMRRSSTPRR